MDCIKCGADITQEMAKALDGGVAIVWTSKRDWICSADGNEHEPGEYIVTPKRALDLAIFAINTFLHPDASEDHDTETLDRRGNEATTVLADLREWVIAQGEDLVLS